jgi:type III restriction enzyme
MGRNTDAKSPICVSVDKDKDAGLLDIQIPIMQPRVHREYKNLAALDVNSFEKGNVKFKQYSSNELREIVFRDIDDNVTHKTVFKNNTPDFRNVVSFLSSRILHNSRLVSGFDALYPKVEAFIKYRLWGKEVSLSDPQTIRNLSEATATQTLYNTFARAISQLTIIERSGVSRSSYASVAKARPIVVKNQAYIKSPRKSLFDKVIGDSEFELHFAAAMEKWSEVAAYAKNTETGVGFAIEYQNAQSQIASYYTDFLVRTTGGICYAVELKGIEDEDAKLKRERLRQWCEDVNSEQEQKWASLYVLQVEWDKYRDRFRSFADVAEMFEMK